MNINPFEKLYLKARQQEGRLYTDEEVRLLPQTDKNNPLYRQWKIRANSAKQLVRYIKTKPHCKNILEIGCGNGWLSAYLAKRLLNLQFTGIDINQTELKQAQRVHPYSNLSFSFCDVFKETPPNAPFQCIVLVSSVQYFPNLHKLLTRLLEMGTDHLEILIIDSPFYDENPKAIAQQASKKHYEEIGVPEMQNFYFHPTYKDLNPFNPIIRSISPLQKILQKTRLSNLSPFPRIIIKKQVCRS